MAAPAPSATPSQTASAPAPPVKRASTSGPSKRQSAATASSAPKPPLSASSRAIIAAHASLSGTHQITLAPHCILHPYSKINSKEGKISIGEGSVIWEKAVVGVQDPSENPSITEDDTAADVSLGKYVVIESMATVQAEEVGNNTHIQSGARVGRGCVIGKHCTIAPHAILPARTIVPDYSIVFGNAQQRTDSTLQNRPDIRELKMQSHEKMLEGLVLLIPNNLSKWQ